MESNKFEGGEIETEIGITRSKETHEAITSKIVLHFFRHGDKENIKTVSDQEVLLTEKGRGQAVEKSEDDDISQSVAFGSPRKRTQQTAGLAMSGQVEGITGDESLVELKEKLDAELEVGSKIGVDKRLDFNDDFSTEFGKKFLDAYKNGNMLKFTVEKTNDLAKELGDEIGNTYNRMAGAVAEIIVKYIKIAPRWNELVIDEQKNYSDTMKRFLGSHAGVLESFLAKVIELTKGVEERDSFVTEQGNQSFEFVEGFDCEIDTTQNGETKVHIKYKKNDFDFDEVVPVEIINKIAIEK